MSVSEPANQSMTPLQLVQRALPVSTATALLECLADAWLQTAGATACHVSVITGQKLQSAFADPVRFEKPFVSPDEITVPQDAWSVRLASDALNSIIDHSSAFLKSVTVVPFEFNERLYGGALLLGKFQDTDNLTTLATVSGQLIEQLRNLQSSTTVPDPISETRLRDLKLEAMAEFAAGAGHEINNPVATIAGRSALLLKTETDPERRRILETIGGQAYRIRDMIGDAMTYARPPEPILEEFEPAAEILQISQNLQQQFLHKQVGFESSLDENIKLHADREQFRVVVSCLIKNSLEAISNTGQIRIELSRMPGNSDQDSLQSHSHIRLAVSDNGVGLSETEREHLFDPFYSGRQAGRGLGFGLSKCWQILRLHGGTIDAVEESNERESATGGLTIITLWPA
ncbi:MAG: HAMP domain-containing histidine kinase [Rhodopirellula sp.]|nr:HAMP domain-containing histidine kinase [Rhodopirellula sp.]